MTEQTRCALDEPSHSGCSRLMRSKTWRQVSIGECHRSSSAGSRSLLLSLWLDNNDERTSNRSVAAVDVYTAYAIGDLKLNRNLITIIRQIRPDSFVKIIVKRYDPDAIWLFEIVLDLITAFATDRNVYISYLWPTLSTSTAEVNVTVHPCRVV